MDGLIIGASSSLYYVQSEGVIYRVAPRGLFRKEKLHVLVGDYVSFDESRGYIEKVYERKNTLKKPAIANVDQILIVISLREPDFSLYLLLKYLTYANYYGITAKVILTKSDLDDKEHIAYVEDLLTKLKVEHYIISNKTMDGFDTVKNIFTKHISVLMGQTGVGKSSFLNVLDPNFSREVGDYSYSLNRGKHKTTYTILLPYLQGYVADTPGFSSLDLELSVDELAKFFPLFSPTYLSCYYNDCKHMSEPKCEVKKQLDEGIIPQEVYDIYCKMYDEILYGEV